MSKSARSGRVFRTAMMQRATTLGLALAGVGLFYLLGLPLPFLFGPMTACLLAALAGAPLRGMGTVSVLARTILGVAVGASITPEVVGRIPQMAGSVALVPLYVVVIGLVGVPFFRRLGYDPVTSWYAAMPGGLQDMVIFGTEAGGGQGGALATGRGPQPARAHPWHLWPRPDRPAGRGLCPGLWRAGDLVGLRGGARARRRRGARCPRPAPSSSPGPRS